MNSSEILSTILAGSLGLIIIIGILLIAFYVFYIVCLWKLFKKAGKNGWEALIPFYNTYVLVEISGLNWWYFLIAISGNIISLINIDNLSWITDLAGYAVNFFIFWNIAKKMHKEPVGIAILGTLFSGIMIPVLGLSKNFVYDSSVAVSPNGPIGDNNTSKEPEKFCLGCGQKLKANAAFCENCGKKVK